MGKVSEKTTLSDRYLTGVYKPLSRPFSKIPKKLHIIWVGDELKCPSDWIQTWKDKHPTWEFKLWGNAELDGLTWRSKKQMNRYRALGHWEGVADLMRYEILYEHGGVYVDADAICVRPLDDWLLDARMFVVWESERHRPGLIANAFIGSVPRHPILRDIVEVTSRMNQPVWCRSWRKVYWKGMRPRFHYEEVKPWISVGPVLFTKAVLSYRLPDVMILPSVLFQPKHHLDLEERESSLIYARHEWGNTHQLYLDAESKR